MTKIQQLVFISGNNHNDVQSVFNRASTELDNVQAIGFNVVNSTVILAYTHDVDKEPKVTEKKKTTPKKRASRKPKVETEGDKVMSKYTLDDTYCIISHTRDVQDIRLLGAQSGDLLEVLPLGRQGQPVLLDDRLTHGFLYRIVDMPIDAWNSIGVKLDNGVTLTLDELPRGKADVVYSVHRVQKHQEIS